MTEYKYHVKSEDGWIDNRMDSTKLYWIRKHEDGVVKLLKTKKRSSDLCNKGYIIKSSFCKNKLDSTLKDTLCPYIRSVNVFYKDTTRYVFLKLKAKVKKDEFVEIKELHFNFFSWK